MGDHQTATQIKATLPMSSNSQLTSRRRGFQERSDALQEVCKGFLQFLGYPAYTTKIAAEDAAYDITRDGSELLVIHHLNRPVFVKSYMVYSEPGMPLIEGLYHSLDDFIRGFYRDEILRSARRTAITIPGFPPPPGTTDITDIADRYIKALDEQEALLEQEVNEWIASAEQQQLARLIWA
jgi:hypothetical protein